MLRITRTGKTSICGVIVTDVKNSNSWVFLPLTVHGSNSNSWVLLLWPLIAHRQFQLYILASNPTIQWSKLKIYLHITHTPSKLWRNVVPTLLLWLQVVFSVYSMLIQWCTNIKSTSFIINSPVDVQPILGKHHLLIKKVIC